MTDPDDDGRPAYIDDDSDGDCVSDMQEAGDTNLMSPPVDTDSDLQRDFLDLDSDNDGLLDALEDDNCNGVVDAGESSRTNADTDGDGASDLIEEAAGTDPTNGADNPQANGDFVFIVPYQAPPSPTDDTLDFATDISQADVAFSVDNTGSMNDEINNIKASLSSLVTSIRGQIPNTGFAVTAYRDFPSGGHGGLGEQPFYMKHRVMTTNTGAGLTSVQNQVNTYVGTGGANVPESGWEALYQIATGAGTAQGSANVPAFNPASAFPSPALAGEETGTIGGVGFRTGSLPIAVWVTDACNHNTPGDLYSFTAATQASAIAALMGISARVIAVVSDPEVCGGKAYTEALSAVNATNSVVPPSAWDGSRPAGCGAGQCCTGIAGVGQAPTGGMCPLVFRVNGNTGAGLGDSVATAVKVLASYAEFDIGGLAQDDPTDSVNAVTAFVDKIEANPNATTPCAMGLTVVDTTGDSVNDTFPQVNPGTTVCFDVVPKMNTTVMPLQTPQMFKATVVVQGDGVTTLDTRDIFFLVPPEIPDVPID